MSQFKQIVSKQIEYLILGIIFTVGLIAFIYFSFNPHFQRNSIYITSGLYFLWSLYHHYHRGDLEISIIIEYLAIILFGLIILSSTFL